MTEPTDCPHCGAKLNELQGLIFRMNDVMAMQLRAARIERRIMKSVVAVNVITVAVFLWRYS